MSEHEHRSATAERAWHEARVALKAAIERAERAEALLDEALAKSAAVIRLTALSGREDGYHYTVPYGVAECQALTALSAFLDRDEVKRRLAQTQTCGNCDGALFIDCGDGENRYDMPCPVCQPAREEGTR